ncbi:aminoglycoside phosphotransferase (APT) family kinase protein [Antricoccus suffuscus]|uniref:Aminoglycoside phosphotransferase (APT) family kinase protein n=1 Tax=Antricoccus suffuscus TaxID=1629062 RepID=A0A2T1A0F4_9ACTN|nr:phosphotransferase family protein [Antricoccus suffuscus]PRZ41967.1 aminoglycoside phosphotransferase (APT) family kinase protein [Antricoccus suffuscus]
MSATREPEIIGLDGPKVQKWIDGLGIGAQLPLTFSRVGAGQSNLTFLVTDTDRGRWVLRRPPLGKLLASAHDVAREHRILTSIEDSSVPTPAVYGLCTDPEVTDVPLMLVEYVDGRVIDDLATAEALTEDQRRRTGLSLARTLGKVHEVDLEATGLDTLASHKPYAERQLKRWRMQWEGSHSRDVPLVNELADRLAAAVPEQRELALVHGDFHLLNVITDPTSCEVSAVLDWELCTLGDPLADVGGLLAYWPQQGDLPVPHAAPTLPGFPTHAQLVAEYAAATGRDTSDVGFWHVLGLWKIAIISDGVRRRAEDDPRNAYQVRSGPSRDEIIDALLARAAREADAIGL